MGMSDETIHGWHSPPDVRGTRDIIYGCLATIGLCSWSCLCLNIPRPGTTALRSTLIRLRWQVFTILFPEVTLAIAAEQWECANQSVNEFKNMGYGSFWTQRHAFFAGMGGFHLETSDFPPFPIDAQQLAYLVRRDYISMPDTTEADIRDKNKADGLARTLALGQLAWFSIQCIGRWIQNLGLTSLELSTLAFVLCTLNIYFFWYNKPYEVQSPYILRTGTTIAKILIEAGDAARIPYSRTPLDFVKPPPDDGSILAPFWIGINSMAPVFEQSGRRPIQYFANNTTMPPNGITAYELLYGLAIELCFFGIHFLGVLLKFPTAIERDLWIWSSGVLTVLFLTYLLGVYLAHQHRRLISMWLFGRELGSIAEMIDKIPYWASCLVHGAFITTYGFARLYILVEGFIGLRQLPSRLYVSVSWSELFPHI